MVAIRSTVASRNVSGISLATLTAPPRQSSLRSITSTHSRNSLVKDDQLHEIHCTKGHTERRVRFDCEDNSDSLDELVFEYEYVDPVEPLYLTASEIMKIRSDARRQASHFSQAYPDVIAEINSAFEDGGSRMNHASQVKKLRRRRQLKNIYDVAFESYDRDEDGSINGQEECLIDGDQRDCDDELVDDANYFCTMRGLETRISPMFRLSRRMTIRNVINFQTEMKRSGCCPTQIQMGLRAVCAQGSQRARAFACYQATLDEFEVFHMQK